MLSLFYGNDVLEVRKKAHTFVHTKATKGADVVVSSENYQPGMIHDLAGAASLFGIHEVVLIDMLSEAPGALEALVEDIALLVGSMHQFVVIEGVLEKEVVEQFTAARAHLEEVRRAPNERFNVFALADALSRHDKKSLWMLYAEAMRSGLGAEEVIGTLYWQLKLLRLAARTKTAEEAFQKEFPYNKAKRALSKFKDGEVDTLSRSLLAVYHDGHRGVTDIDIALERWILSL